MPAEAGRTVELTSATKGSFGKITYPLASAGKTYQYTITEDLTFGDGWTKSQDITATVVVGEDTGSGSLTTAVTYNPVNDTITNTYDANGSMLQFKYKQIKDGAPLEMSTLSGSAVSYEVFILQNVKTLVPGLASFKSAK